MEPTIRTALVTGATSGLGYEVAAQIAERDRGQVIITGRTKAKARDARDTLRARTGRNVTMSADGIERTISSSLIGHHILTMRLLEAGHLDNHARIVIAASEAARGDVPTFHPADFRTLALKHFDGDVEAAIMEQPHITDRQAQRAGWNTTVRVSGFDLSTSVSQPASVTDPALVAAA